jgi:hypothetical protein
MLGWGLPMREPFAVAAGFLFAAAVPAIFISVATPLGGERSLYGMSLSLLFFYFTFLPLVVAFGLPAFLLLRPFRPGHWWSVGITGFLLGVLLEVVIRLPYRPNLKEGVYFGFLATMSAVVFWLVWKRNVNPQIKRD